MTSTEGMGFNDTQVERMLELYPSDPRLGVPYNTGEALSYYFLLDRATDHRL